MTIWSPIKGGWLYGIAKSHYSQDAAKRLSLTTGDAIIIKSESENWYFGYKKDDRHQHGIFPKNFVVIVDAYKCSDGFRDVYKIKRSSIVEEITTVLKEWHNHLNSFYLNDKKNFIGLQEKMLNLIKLRQQLLSGNLPTDEFRELKLKATAQIDTGNNMLKLDMVVRDDAGDIIDFSSISTTQLYELHCKAVERIKQSTTTGKIANRNRNSKNFNIISHNFLVTVNNIQCKFVDDMELLFTIYTVQASQVAQLTENYLVPWVKGDSYKEIKLLFTDMSTDDIDQTKLFLVAFMVRVGAMEARDPDAQQAPRKTILPNFSIGHRRESSISNQSLSVIDHLRRPFGVAILDLTPIRSRPGDFDNSIDMTIHVHEKECLDAYLRRVLMNRDKPDAVTDTRNISVSVEMLHGDIKQIKEDYAHILRNISFARKMGFPEVILPGDIRNDLYLTLVGADLAKSVRRGETNIEVHVTVCLENGDVVPNAISKGGGSNLEDEYRTIVYAHDEHPKWVETIKIVLPIENFKHCHVRFLFKHRHSQESKDKGNKPFALAHMKLMAEDETAIQQGEHSLAVYKIDKKIDDSMMRNYLTLPTKVDPAAEKPSTQGFSFQPKDSFYVKTNLCSTRLTQDRKLLSLLNWQSNKEALEQSLQDLLNVDEAEMVKFLQDILDALFFIFDAHAEHEKLVFQNVVRLIDVVSNPKYKLFESVLDLYIKEGFSATLAYSKLIELLRSQIFDTVHLENTRDDDLFKVLKHLHYIMKFIVQSRILFTNCTQLMEQNKFDTLIEGLLVAFNILISNNNPEKSLLKSKGAVLKYLHVVASDLIKVYDPIKLSHKVEGIINSIPPGHLSQSKMIAIKDLVESQIFRLPQCRAILLPVFCKQIVERLEGNSEMQECINILNNVLKNLSRTNIGTVEHDIKTIMTSILRTIIQSVVAMSDDNPLKGNLVAIMLGIFHHMRADHYRIYVQNLPSKLDKQDFLSEILCVFANLVQKSVFPPDWMDMIMHQNTVILESLRHFSVIIMEHFYTKNRDNEVTFVKDVWSKFFHCATSFLVQKSLQIDQFSSNKKSIIIKRYRDIRRETAVEVRRMWFNLGEYKVHFIPELVGSILEMSMLPDEEIRKASIPIFPDMMMSEALSSRYVPDSFGDTKRNSGHCKGNFNDFETEMIKKLDHLIQRGDGDEAYRHLFDKMMTGTCKQVVNLKEEGVAFVKKAVMLMGKLLEYRNVLKEQSIDNQMACIVQILEFYAETKHTDMYVRYLARLYNLHKMCDNYTEAAYTVKKLSGLLKWDDIKLSNNLKCEFTERFEAITHRELKEQLHHYIIELFDKGRMWETALDVCKELAYQFETETYDYKGLSELHKRMSGFYQKILNEYNTKDTKDTKETKDPKDAKDDKPSMIRVGCEYFRVGFYGQGFPEFLRNKQFIYRGAECEKLESFNTRLQRQHPKAELLQNLEIPGRDIQDAKVQYIQAVAVKPIPSEKLKILQDKFVHENIANFYKSNNVQKFELRRPYYAEGFAKDDVAGLWVDRMIMETATPLPNILKSSLITNVTITKVSPIQNAIETMEKENKSLRELVVKYSVNPNAPIQQLSMKLNGVVEAAVMGGLKVYENAFLSEEYSAKNPRDYSEVQKLKDLIANQMPLLQNLVTIHKELTSKSNDLQNFHKNIEEKFNKMQTEIEEKYGKRTADFDQIVVLRRSVGVHIPTNANRQSGESVNSEGSDKNPRSIMSQIFQPTLTRNKKRKKSSRETSLWHVSDVGDDNRSYSSLASYDMQSPSTPTPSIVGMSPSARIELSEPLTPKRPLRSEHDRRMSRPPSTLTNGSVLSLDSNLTEVISDTETDSVPPPVPPKNPRDSDLFGSIGGNSNRSSGESSDMTRDSHSTAESIYSPVYNPSYETIALRSKPVQSDYVTNLSSIISGKPIDFDDKKRAPTPPPKPSRSAKSTPTKERHRDFENNNVE
ncbi:dedicator of cytokinesis protein 1 isoform X2 [Culicoides brevitarsis]|uniref:dedicator of cytokinesis protein 1 isoform X2 n=1 Tax=Culicoides brevitarsis TaxID=469753 RepID=UPI00307B9618